MELIGKGMRGKSRYTPPQPLELFGLKRIELDGENIAIRFRDGNQRRTRVVMFYHPDGILFIEHPKRTTERTLRLLIYRSEPWLRKEVRKAKEGAPIAYPSSYQSGKTVYLLGTPFKLKVVRSESTNVTQFKKTLRVSVEEGVSAQYALYAWYYQQAAQLLGESLNRMHESTRIVENSPAWTHGFVSSRWGSCSAKGRIRLNSHLVKVPQRCIDMVVLHELCHLKVHNHGPDFYALMREHMPDWRKWDDQIKNYQMLLFEPRP